MWLADLTSFMMSMMVPVAFGGILLNLVYLILLTEITCGKMRQLVSRKIHTYEVVWCFGLGPVAGRMILDPQLGRICHNAKVAVILVVVVLEYHLISLTMLLLNNLWRARS